MFTLSPQIQEMPASDTQTVTQLNLNLNLNSDPIQNGYPHFPIEESFPECTRLDRKSVV